ncbi:nitrate reductase molybdenum cofactor assembly chaperone [Paraconexibacter antarcticus]|uniref:Nitrate reductase molybdenum cofactor assembly chaperone n=1 Tax=Paraconexibacter antarcticus TaxID=2949664 RepID=A0ABY5DZY1_9ACTN|nr:nitrate reductase molybdenum cofactor assembly chaperone [Paraconexibacter antarcticus]UTI66913.1 nitrate reductase molybdenum cofactor assembly chaperone [Paraconexibacter antarcticus]
MRRPRSRPQPPPYALLSHLMRYPEDGLALARTEVDALPAGEARVALERFLAAIDDGTDPRVRYVATFDLKRQITPHLTYYEHGDTRRRGVALLRLKRLYREAGLPVADGELPDHLAVMLAFTALAPAGYGDAVLAEHRAALELLRGALHQTGNAYAHVLDALVCGLPALRVEDRDELVRMAAEGPPDEAVGLEPFAPPEVMPIGGRR